MMPPTLLPTQRALASHDRPRRISGTRVRTAVVGGRYRLIECLGEGGMGTVWRARDCVLGSDVAVKLHSGHTDPLAVEALLREANAAARVHHPSSIRVLEFGVCADGTPFIVMDLARGETLAEHLKR